MARGVSYALASSVFFWAGIAVAASPQQPQAGGPARSSAQFTLRREEAGGNDATIARSRARAGDCAGALPAFDSAIRTTIEPTLRRDRGLCHEKLGDAYPAIEDYRAYLSARPEANDADQIRERLARLEEATGQGGPSAEAAKSGEGSGASASASASIGEGGASASSQSSSAKAARADRGAREKSYDEYLAQEKLADAAETSPLRYGSGWIIGPFLTVPKKYFTFGSGGGVQPNITGYTVGATIRYATGPTLTIITELGYGGIGTSGEANSASGPEVFFGGEARFPFSRYASDQIYAGLGLGFERFVVGSVGQGADLVPLRARLGYRHVFGPAVALEVGPDLGIVILGVPDGGKVQTGTGGSIGGALAFLVAF